MGPVNDTYDRPRNKTGRIGAKACPTTLQPLQGSKFFGHKILRFDYSFNHLWFTIINMNSLIIRNTSIYSDNHD